ncbi:MAG: hypothetical protein JO170_33855 [Verrucomicrobia bacterium]|nr:hypothetical protein [Verrucomicrobiota bacterium]
MLDELEGITSFPETLRGEAAGDQVGTQKHARSRTAANPPERRSTCKGRIVKDGVRKTVKDRQLAPYELVKAIREFRQVLPVSRSRREEARMLRPCWR